MPTEDSACCPPTFNVGWFTCNVPGTMCSRSTKTNALQTSRIHLLQLPTTTTVQPQNNIAPRLPYRNTAQPSEEQGPGVLHR